MLGIACLNSSDGDVSKETEVANENHSNFHHLFFVFFSENYSYIMSYDCSMLCITFVLYPVKCIRVCM